MTDPYKKVGVAKRFLLRRLGAGPGEAIFSCEHLLGDSVEVVDARDFDAVVDDAARFAMRRDKDAARYRFLHACVRRLTVHLNRDYILLHPQYISATGFEADMAVLDTIIDKELKR
jgi:hypothetical protein